MNLKDIKDPTFLKLLNKKELKTLATDIRSFLIENISQTGGHLASNLGAVELTIGLHYVFDSPKDSILFDVSHQAYTHKILTGRAKDFPKLRQKGGISGYTKYLESVHDKWESGHAGTSIAAMTGYLYANKLKGENNHVISVVGDASVINGTNMEALNFLGQTKDDNGIIIINDNDRSISKSVGAFSLFLTKLRGSVVTYKIKNFFSKITPNFLWRIFRRIKRSVQAIFQTGNMFEDMGYTYIGPVNGNNVTKVIKTLKLAKKLKGNVVIHMITQKGKGYNKAESDEDGHYHGVGAFDKEKGLHEQENSSKISWSEGIATTIDHLAEPLDLFVVMPAMLVGSKFIDFQNKYPNRIVDVGIAEEHAAVMAASLSLNGINVFLPLYSTFAQRAYDQILNDIARPHLKVVIGIDRAGFVGEDGSTHQGLYDVAMFLSMPNVIVTMPRDLKEAYGIIKYGFMQDGPFVIRYPRGNTKPIKLDDFEAICPSWNILVKGTKGIVVSYGPYLDVLEKIIKEENLDVSLINARYIKPIDEKLLNETLKTGLPVLVYEQIHANSSLYHLILDFMAKNNYHNKVVAMNVTDKIIEHGTVDDNITDAKLDKKEIIDTLKTL